MSANAPDSAIVVFTTLGSVDDAAALVQRLVGEGVVACGTVIDEARSIYRWQGTVQDEREALVILKTRRERWEDLESAVRETHPYEVPELLALPVERGLAEYLAWVHEQTGEERHHA